MNKWTKISIVGGAVLLLVILLYFFGFKKSDDSYASDDWTLSYDPDERGPYGTYMLKELLDTTGMFGNFLKLNEKLEEKLEDDPEINDIYFFVGDRSYLTDSSTAFLLKFVEKGNTAFLSSEDFPDELLDWIGFAEEKIFEDDILDSTQYFKFEHSNFRGKRYQFDFIFNNKLGLKSWYYFDPSAFYYREGDTLITLGSDTKDQCNFLKIKYGNGQIFLHSAPYVFTNISMMKRDGFQYAENILKHVPPGRVQWDKYNLDYHYEYDDGDDGGNGGEKRESMLQFIVNNPPLLWALIILLVGGLLYALFKGKRMQKIVPATESKDNTSLQYISTLSSLYLQERRHNKLVRLKAKTFLNFIADHYYIQSSKLDDTFFEKVAVKSHVPKEKIRDIFRTFKVLERSPEVSDQELIALHQKIENFYKTCR